MSILYWVLKGALIDDMLVIKLIYYATVKCIIELYTS